jgi:hypothetical protein
MLGRPVDVETKSYVLIIFGTTSSGLGALGEFSISRGTVVWVYPELVAIVSSGSILQDSIANGMGVEDFYEGDQTGYGTIIRS